jgi:hypothetical protein
MRTFRRFGLELVCFTLVSLLVGCYPAPEAARLPAGQTTPAPTLDSLSGTSQGTTNLLAGTISGLDPGDNAELRLEFVEASVWSQLLPTPPTGQALEPGEVVERFQVANGAWQAAGLALGPGRYRLIPEAEAYVSTRGRFTFWVPGAPIAWRYRRLDFEFLRPTDATARLGVPLCPTLPAAGGVYVLPEGAPTPTPSPPPPGAALSSAKPEAWSSGTCYAGHLGEAEILPSGLLGDISGLTPGQAATVNLYALPPEPGENYAMNEPPPPDGTWHYPPEVTPLADRPAISPDWPLTATLTLRNGVWGLVDPSLAGGKYLVVAQAAGLVAEPAAYEVVIFAGKVPGLPGHVDFTFATTTSSPTPSIGLSPEDWLRQLYAKGPPEPARSLRILGRREWEKGVLLFISYRDVGLGGEMFGYSLLERVPEGEGWTTAGGQLHGSSETRPASEFVDWGMGAGGGMKTALGVPVEMRQDPVVVYGRALTPDVQAVAVTFTNGQRLRDEAPDGMFAIVLEPTALACEVLVLGKADQVLWRIDLTEERRGSPGIARPKDCAGR